MFVLYLNTLGLFGRKKNQQSESMVMDLIKLLLWGHDLYSVPINVSGENNLMANIDYIINTYILYIRKVHMNHLHVLIWNCVDLLAQLH